MLTENSYISDLDISDNNLRSYGANLIAQMLVENTALRKIDLSGNNFNDGDMEIMLKYIQEHGEFKYLNVSHNDLGDRSGSALGNFISESTSLKELDISWNHIRMRGAMDISRGVRDNVGLKSLYASWNGFGDDGAKEMANALKTSSIEEIDLTSNRIGAEGFVAMAKSLKENDDLTLLNLSRNPIPDEAGIAALEFFLTLEELNLKKLDLGEIMLSNKFSAKLEEVTEKHKDFQCPFGYTDMYGKRKLKCYSLVEEALQAMKDYCASQGITIVELFARFDDDGSMSVSHDEFKEGIRDAKISISEQHVQELINALDEDGDGEIDFSELVLGAERLG